MFALPAGAFATPPTSSVAATTDALSWSVQPGGSEKRTNFGYKLAAGASRSDSFVVTNLGLQEITLAIYAADGTTSSTGALDLLPAAEPSSNIGAWVKVEKPLVTLAAGERTEVGFTLKVPTNAEPGDYVGGLISSYADTSSGNTVLVDRRLATRMNVQVAGEGKLSLKTTDVSITSTQAWNPFAPVRATVRYTVENTGTVRARGAHVISVSGPFGLAEKTVTDPGLELIPGGSAQRTVAVEGIWPLFALSSEVRIIPEGIDSTPGTAVHATAGTAAIPWGQLGVLVLVLGTAVTIGAIRGRRPAHATLVE